MNGMDRLFLPLIYNKMSGRKYLSEEEKRIIHILSQAGHKGPEISKLRGVNVKTVYKVLKRAEVRGTTDRAKGSGRPRKMTERMLRVLRREVRYNRRATLAELTSALPERLHYNTVRRALRKLGYSNRIAVKKPYLTATHKALRLLFAKQYKNWTVEDWKKVIWTDESSFENGKNSAAVLVWRLPTEKYLDDCLAPTFKSGRSSLMVWGAIRYGAKSKLHFLGEEERKGAGFVASVYDGPLLEFYGMEQGLILMEDGAPVHRCNIANQWRKERGIDVLCWPSQSPDLNPIENLWMIMKRKVQQHRSRVGKFKNVEEHKACLQKVWDEMNPED